MAVATEIVKNSYKDTTGFIIDGHYIPYYSVLHNIQMVSNLTIGKDGVIKPQGEMLQVVSALDINKRKSDEITKENHLERDIQQNLLKWKNKWNKYVLYLTGARQTGKTTELLKFAYNYYEQIIYVNLANGQDHEYFVSCVIQNANMYFGMKQFCISRGLEDYCDTENTILIIDEIQESAEIYNHIRALQGNLKCHVAVTGSYLGKTLNSRYFKPAGNLYEIEMLPLSFREFCRAFELEKLLMDIDIYGSSTEEAYRSLTDKYRIYRQVGGYPAVVSRYIETKSIQESFEVISTIIDRFTEESAAYFENDKCAVIFKNVYKAAFISISQEKKGTSSKDISDITDFVKEDTKEHVSRAEINKALSWLKYSKIIGSSDLYNQGSVNELLNERRFYFMDCGIANYIAQNTAIPNAAVEGILMENFAYTELYRLFKTDKVKGDVPCCAVYQNFELDYMIVDKNDIRYGIEVKTSSAEHPKSISAFIEHHLIDQAYLAGVTRGGIGEKSILRKIPIYTVGCRFPYEE